MPHLTKPPPVDQGQWNLLQPWISDLLSGDSLPAGALPLEQARMAGVLPWMAYRLFDSGALQSLGTGQQKALKESLRKFNLVHLDCEAELERLLASADKAGIRFLAFKGHSVARMLYPHPACRPTSDFDLLIDPVQIDQVWDWLTSADYRPSDPFAGILWLGAQNWIGDLAGNARFHVDVHWDYTSRMFFRRRLSFEEVWAESQQAPCGGVSLHVPCTVDNLIFACVHLAAFDPGWKVKLVWLLDIYLLMEALDEAEIALLLARAGKARAIEACLVHGERAAELGDREKLLPVLEALRGRANEKRWAFYQRTLRNRGLDLGAYWLRLSWGGKFRFFGDLVRWVRVRDRG